MAHEHHSTRRHAEFVVLEIGSGLGALIVHTERAMHGVEIEISPVGADSSRTHKEVLERVAGDSSAYTAVFDQLPAGDYTLWVDGVARTRGVTVPDGGISRLDWRGGAVVATR